MRRAGQAGVLSVPIKRATALPGPRFGYLYPIPSSGLNAVGRLSLKFSVENQVYCLLLMGSYFLILCRIISTFVSVSTFIILPSFLAVVRYCLGRENIAVDLTFLYLLLTTLF